MKKTITLFSVFFAGALSLQGVDVTEQQEQAESSYQLVKSFTRSECAQRYARSRFGSKNFYRSQILTESDSAWKELDMDLLIAKLDKAYTAAGSVEFRKLMHPVSDDSELLERQEFIKALLDNQEELEKICTMLSTFAEQYENSFANVLEPLTADPFELVRKNAILPMTSSTKVNLILQLGMMFFGTGQAFAYDAFHLRQDMQQMAQPGWRMRAWLGMNSLGVIAALAYSGYYNVLAVKNMINQIPQADAVVLKIGQSVALTRKLSDVLNQNYDLQQSEVARLFNKTFASGSEQLREIVYEILERERIEKAAEASCVATGYKYWAMPDSLDLFYKIKLARDLFGRMLHAIGILDAYVSIVRLHNEWQEQHIPVSYVAYESADKPCHDFKQLYNPLIGSSVANDFVLGGSYKAHHTLLTGPHACGKTTSMKTLAYGYILGQTITVVPAKAATCAPLTKLKTYFNIGDNLAEGLSSFTAEHGRLDELCQEANEFEKQDRCLMLVDEPLAKTIQLIGEPRVTDFIKKLLPVDPLMLVVATHFEDPVRLEAETNGFIKNMQPEVLVLAGSQFKPTFKILDGKADWWFHDKQKREAFVDWLLTR